ncbi:Uncharacterised protein [Mycobacterium tuberculosis]|nr:Uncharacterised protein [Mycobacterium tuberculosis]
MKGDVDQQEKESTLEKQEAEIQERLNEVDRELFDIENDI